MAMNGPDSSLIVARQVGADEGLVWPKWMRMLCRPIIRSYRTTDSLRSSDRFCQEWLCPPIHRANLFWSLFFTTILSYGVLVSLFGSSALPVLNANGNFSAPVSLSNGPDGTLFGLYMLVVLGLIAGWLINLVKLPPLLGMLLVGIACRNLPAMTFGRYIAKYWATLLRRVAFVVILIQGGLGLDVDALKRLKSVCIQLAFIPCIVEAVTVGLMFKLLFDYDWIYGFMLGFVLGAVSPAICVPSMLNLQERGFGVDQGIPTLVIASSSIDDVLAITAFSVLLSITFSQGSIFITIIRAPLEVILGIIYGIIFGVILWYIPDSQQHEQAECVTQVVSFLWTIPFEPLLFGLIGSELDLANAVDWSSILHTLCVLGVALACRSLAAFLAVFGASFNIKERLFISMAWLPKATVQAALGPVVYDTAVSKYGSDEQISAGLQILTTAVISILLTAPLGAALIYITGPYLLRKTSDKEDIREMDVIAKNEDV